MNVYVHSRLWTHTHVFAVATDWKAIKADKGARGINMKGYIIQMHMCGCI